MKKLFKTLVISSTLLLSAGAALAEGRVADHRIDRTERPAELMIKPGPDVMREDVLAVERAFGRRGTLTLDVRGGHGMKKNLFLVSSDDRLAIRFVRITYASGRQIMLRGSQARALDLPDGGRIETVEVAYVNRGARGAVVKLIAKSGRGRGNGRGFDRGFDRFADEG